jgi:signal transduction histidine kinase/DNA-binding response OmpR family regulator
MLQHTSKEMMPSANRTCIVDWHRNCIHSAKSERDLARPYRSLLFRYGASVLPGVMCLAAAVMINAHDNENRRLNNIAEKLHLVTANLDLQFGQLTKLTAYCATSPALIDRVDFQSVAENCGRYAAHEGAWVVIVETGQTHRQLLNTIPNAPAVLPSYPLEREVPALRALEKSSRTSGEPGLSEVFTGHIMKTDNVSAGQFLRLADGREVMLYVTSAVRSFSDQLERLSAKQGPIFGLIDPSERIVARSSGIEELMFESSPDWLHEHIENNSIGVAPAVPGPKMIGGFWDVAYQPVKNAPGWTAVAVAPISTNAFAWAPISRSTAFAMFGLILTVMLLWVIRLRDRSAHRIEMALRAEAKASRQNEEKSQLLASFAHDIRSPLISLIGSLELIETGSNSDIDQLRTARVSAEALLQFVDDILELSFLGSAAMALHPSPVDLRQLVESLLAQSQRFADQKGLQIRHDLDQGIPAVVEIDRLRLQQVLSNLLTNALKYTERGTITLRIRLKGLELGFVNLEIAVIDTGPGIEREDIPKILSEFGRLQRYPERIQSGSGLGLAIVQRILHSMGTNLVVDSVLGQGSSFNFLLTLPIPTERALNDVARPFSGVSILYVEDEPVIRQITERRLIEAGAQVLIAFDGADALRKLEGLVPDLLLVDLQMPGLNGVELIRRLRKSAPDLAYPIFVLTSHISGVEAAQARAVGADAIFTKPVQVTALAAAFRARHGNDGRSTPTTCSAVEAANDRFLDLDTFQEATQFMAPQTAAALVAEFEVSMRKDLNHLVWAVEEGDLTLAGELAHRCLGLCLVMGAANLVERMRTIEEIAIRGNVENTRALVAEIDQMLTFTLVQMSSKLGSLPSA